MNKMSFFNNSKESDDNTIVLYHGSNKIIDKPDFNFKNTNNDYGSGFYTTRIKERADAWALTNGDNKAYLNAAQKILNNSKNIALYFPLDSSLFRVSVNKFNYSSVESAVANGIPRKIAILSKLINYPGYSHTDVIDEDWEYAIHKTENLCKVDHFVKTNFLKF